jgi:hypothetical protein
VIGVRYAGQVSRALGRYELLRPLARGGMAELFLARRRAAGVEKLLVIKRVRAERAGDPRFLELFVREARLSMSLAHQNIVPVFDFGRSGDQVFLAMERVEGRDLGSTLARPGVPPLPPVVAAFVTAECCQALAYAHGRRGEGGAALGIVHRDVTPRNVLLSWAGEVKLTDFGIAALAGDDVARLTGTPGYMAPEQARGEPLDARADVYAVGLVLREALTGARARPGADRDELLAAARDGRLAPWPARAEPLPPALVAIAERATAADPSVRFPDAASLLAALDAFIVAERGARPGEAPARQLAAWLAAAWAGAPTEDAAADAQLPAELVSLFDDAAAGTGTERSLAATAADAAMAGAPDPAHPAVPAEAAPDRGPAAGPPAAAGQPPGGPPPDARPRAGPAAARAGRARERRRLIAAAGAALALALTAAVALRAGRRDASPADDPASPAPTTALAARDGAAPRAPAVDRAAAAPAPPAAEPGAREPPRAAPADAPPRDAAAPRTAAGDASPAPPADRRAPPAARRPPPRAVPPAAAAAPPPAAGDASPASPRRRVRINARPWALFTVDGDAARHETITVLELAPGPHRLRFWNPELGVTRDVTIEVPADRDIDHVEDLRR